MQCVASCSYAAPCDSTCCAPARTVHPSVRQPRGCRTAQYSATVLRQSMTGGLGPSWTCSSRQARRSMRVRASGSNGAGPEAQGKPEFGYTRKDIILIGGGLIGFGFAMYYGLQAGGVDALVAGNFVQLFVIVGICLGYISTYFIRVANKDMTYVKQLKDYENAVMAKRLEEMPETEKERLAAEVAAERAAAEERRSRAREDQGGSL